jgi:hypothetical protein
MSASKRPRTSSLRRFITTRSVLIPSPSVPWLAIWREGRFQRIVLAG